KERTIYQRERAVGLSRSAYLMSKVVVLGTVTVAQAVVLTLVALLGVRLNAPGGKGVLLPPLVEITIAVALLSFTAMMLGLLVSGKVTDDPLFAHSAGVWLLDIGMLVALSVLFGVLVSRLLRRHEPAIMRK